MVHHSSWDWGNQSTLVVVGRNLIRPCRERPEGHRFQDRGRNSASIQLASCQRGQSFHLESGLACHNHSEGE